MDSFIDNMLRNVLVGNSWRGLCPYSQLELSMVRVSLDAICVHGNFSLEIVQLILKVARKRAEKLPDVSLTTSTKTRDYGRDFFPGLCIRNFYVFVVR